MKCGTSAESPSTSRILLIAVLRLRSTSTNVSGQRRFCNSSRVTTSPGRSSRMASTWNGCPLNFSFTPSLRSSPVRRSASECAEPYKPRTGLCFRHRGRSLSVQGGALGCPRSPARYQLGLKNRWQLCRSTSFPYFIDMDSTPNPLEVARYSRQYRLRLATPASGGRHEIPIALPFPLCPSCHCIWIHVHIQ